VSPFSIASYGVTVSISVANAALLEAVTRIAPDALPGSKLEHGEAARFCYSLAETGSGVAVRRGGRNLISEHDRAAAVRRLCSDIRLKVAAAASSPVFIHAGVVGWKGRAIVLPGRTFAGKSTLVASLLRLGATYLSDEFALLGAGGLVYPYPCKLHIRSGQGHGDQLISPSCFGALVGVEPLPVGLLLFLKYRPEGDWRVRTLSPGIAALGLLRNAVAARMYPAETLQASALVAAQAPAFRGQRGDAQAAAEEILTMCDNY